MMNHRILLLAGEESGVLYAERIADRLKSAGAEIRGYADYGFRTADLAVFGFWAVVRRIFYFLRVARTMKRAMREWRPAALVRAIVWLKKDAMAILRSYGIAPPPDSGGIASGMPYLPGFEKMFLKSVG